MSSSSSATLTKPKSIAHWSDPFTFLVVIIGIYMACRNTEMTNIEISVWILVVLSILMCGLEVLRAPWRNTPRPDVPFKDVLKSAAVKWVGSMTGLALVLFCWWAMQEYQRSQYYPLFYVLPNALMITPIIVFLTHLFTEWRLGPSGGDGKDLGLFTLGRWKDAQWSGIRDELLTWFIKGFFFAINFCELPKTLKIFRGREDTIMNMPWTQLQPVIIWIIYALIIAAIMPGYLFSARIFGTHVRRIADTWFAYIVTLICYSPMVQGVFARWVNFHPVTPEPDWMKPWVSQFHGSEIILYTIGIIIIMSELVHYWAESIFGARSSNLCNRGIITAGPFHFCKHPVYTAKCFSWILIWLPFMSGDTWLECVRLTIAFIGVCVIFGARGWAEERILAEDPEYVQYALWIDQHGMFAWAGKLVPLLSFRWRLQRWIKRGEISPSVLPQ